jgi:hypothetical protein
VITRDIASLYLAEPAQKLGSIVGSSQCVGTVDTEYLSPRCDDVLIVGPRLSLLAQYGQGVAEIVCRRKSVGMMNTQDSPPTGEGVLMQRAGLLVLMKTERVLARLCAVRKHVRQHLLPSRP